MRRMRTTGDEDDGKCGEDEMSKPAEIEESKIADCFSALPHYPQLPIKGVRETTWLPIGWQAMSE